MSFRVQDASSQRILDALKTIDVLRLCAIQYGVGVVEPRAEDWSGNHVDIADGRYVEREAFNAEDELEHDWALKRGYRFYPGVSTGVTQAIRL